MIIDFTPQAGRLATWCAANRIGYVGVCQTEYQKEYILKQAEAEVMSKLADPVSGISIPKFVNAEKNEKKEGTTTEVSQKRTGESGKADVEPAQKKPKITPAAVTPKQKADAGESGDPDGSSEKSPGAVTLSPALAKLLKAASSKDDIKKSGDEAED